MNVGKNVGKMSERCRKDVGRQGGFHSRSSVFRILNKYGIKLNRGKHSGPIKKKGERKNSQDKKLKTISKRRNDPT